MDSFADNDDSEGQLRSQFLLAALAGLGRVEGEAVTDFASDLDFAMGRKTRWSRAIDIAARKRQPGTVAVLAGVGMQGRDWRTMSPMHLYHIVRALRLTGMEAEARMIAAEAITRV
jgi:hypothetical protein